MFVEAGDVFFEILDSHASRRAAAGHARQIRRVQAKFVHARLEPRRKIARTRRICGNRQTAHGRLHAPAPAVFV
jgi:hypothetical protein